jgi:fructose/tagatose bisphosphate aldolase
MEKQTAVEWLRKELETIPNYSAFYINNYQWIDSIINEAKEMEKEQIIKAHGNKQKTKSNANSIVTYAYTYTGEMYFNDNYY